MARTIKEVPYRGQVSRVDQAIRNYMATEKFAEIDNDGEMCFIKGSSLWSGLQMFKFEYSEVRSCSAGLTGIIAAWTKGRAKYRMDQLLEVIEAVK